MHRFLAVIVCVAGLASPLRAQGVVDSDRPLDLNRIMAAEIDSLERRHAMCFPDGCRPVIRVGTMDELQGGQLNGLYRAESTLIIIHPALGSPRRLELPLANHVSVVRPMVLGVINHELGHAYADWVSRTTWGRTWPFAYVGQPLASSLGLMIQSEGIGVTFKRGLSGPTFRSSWWPTYIDPTQFRYGTPDANYLVYEGGYQLVGSLAARYGLTATVAYIIDHPLVIDLSNVRLSITSWYVQAVLDLTRSN